MRPIVLVDYEGGLASSQSAYRRENLEPPNTFPGTSYCPAFRATECMRMLMERADVRLLCRGVYGRQRVPDFLIDVLRDRFNFSRHELEHMLGDWTTLRMVDVYNRVTKEGKPVYHLCSNTTAWLLGVARQFSLDRGIIEINTYTSLLDFFNGTLQVLERIDIDASLQLSNSGNRAQQPVLYGAVDAAGPSGAMRPLHGV